MRFKKLTIENFGPYKDKEILDFTNYDGVIIIWGDNGRGKTSIMNAFNFLFFNKVKDKFGHTDDFFSFINDLGKEDGKYGFTISLDLEMDDIKYKVTRSLIPIHPEVKPSGNEDFYSDLSVNEGGNIVDKDRAEHILNRIMPEEVARFFLFDGEMLQQYEALLNENDAESFGIKKNIEQILGLPVLTFGAADTKTCYEKYSAAATKTAQNDTKTKKLADKVSALTLEISEQEKDQEELRKNKKNYIADKVRIDKDLQNTEKLRDLYNKRERILSSIAEKESRLAEEKKEIADLLLNAWPWMVARTVSQQRKFLNEDIQKYGSQKSASQKQKQTLQYVRELIDSLTCPICDHHFNESEMDHIKAKLEREEQGIVDLSAEEEEIYQKAMARSNILREFDIANNDQANLIRRCEAVNDLNVDISDLKNTRLPEIETDINNISKGEDLEEEVRRVVDDLSVCMKNLADTEEGLRNIGRKIEELKNQKINFNNQINTLSTNKDTMMANKKEELAHAIHDIFLSAIDVYRDRLKMSVEQNATELFIAMSDEEDYGGLSINNSYGLTIVDKKEGKAIPHPSAGWEHMVAFSLIGALHKNAPFEGPIIMDFPFSRMSNIKRQSMMKAIPQMSSQVVLLVFPGEIDPQHTRLDIGKSIVSEYTLERVNGKHSHIKRGGYNG